MPDVTSIRVGGRFAFELMGKRSNYSLSAEVVAIAEDTITVLTHAGRRISFPAAAVRSAVLTSEEAPTSHDDGQTALRRTQAELAGALSSGLATASTQADLVERAATIRSNLEDIATDVSSRVNRARVDALLDALDSLQPYLKSDTLSSATAKRKEALTTIRALRALRAQRAKEHTLPAVLDHAIRAVMEIESSYWRTHWEPFTSPPRIVTRDVINLTREPSGEFELPVRVALDKDAIEVENVRLVLDKFRSLKIIGSTPRLGVLRGGETVTLKTRMRDNRKQGARADVRIEAHVTYKTVDGEIGQSARQVLDLRIRGKESHNDIPNPFRPYAGGLPIEDPAMFFGRAGLVTDFVRELAKPSGGTCFALYGQQRTGKSSVLEQVRSRLVKQGAIVASLSIGRLDRRSITVDFVEEILDQYRVQVNALLPADQARTLLNRWPDTTTIERKPMRSLQRAREAAGTMLRSVGVTGTSFVVVVDEFTYLHEVLLRRGIDPREHNELRDFMRQLKGLLEAKVFSALLVGQDTMPKFLDSYPNEFSVMATRKLDYLTHDETQDLADKPVKLPGDFSRYSGYALATIATYTDGHPFFTQILCDRLITMVNSKKRSEITQSDVEEAIETLISGRDRIEGHKFDCLVTADNSDALISQMGNQPIDGRASDIARTVLHRMANLAGSQNHPVPVDDLQLDVQQRAALEDLVLRGVVRESDAGVSIRVLLYADYLRRRG